MRIVLTGGATGGHIYPALAIGDAFRARDPETEIIYIASGKALEKTIECVYQDFGVRPIALGCHEKNTEAARFYEKHGFEKTSYREGNDIYYLRYPKE